MHELRIPKDADKVKPSVDIEALEKVIMVIQEEDITIIVPSTMIPTEVVEGMSLRVMGDYTIMGSALNNNYRKLWEGDNTPPVILEDKWDELQPRSFMDIITRISSAIPMIEPKEEEEPKALKTRKKAPKS